MIGVSYDIKLFTDGPHCVREGCQAASADGSAFCEPCRMWLCEKTDVDPLDDAARVAKPQQTSSEMWLPYVEMLAGGGMAE